MTGGPLRLFEGFGIELEYMIVDRETSVVRPIAEVLLREDGQIASEVERGDIAWCNELVAHVIELKTNGPTAHIDSRLSAMFEQNVREINGQLRDVGACLMPSAMHPTMDPFRETVLWPHEYNEVYRTFDAIFDCSGHGWSNLQSTHINLPFHGDDEFARLHAAIRFVLPIIPALSASSPIMNGSHGGWLDGRLNVYRRNARRIPSVTGLVVPEAIETEQSYQVDVLERIYADLAQLDPRGVLRHEWVNARGAIARFDRGTMEIRVIDVQECPRADLAVAAAVIGLVRRLATVDDMTSDLNAVPTEALSALLLRVAQHGEETSIEDLDYLARCEVTRPCSAAELWHHLITGILSEDDTLDPWRNTIEHILENGSLARRILRSVGNECEPERIQQVYRTLCDCLEQGVLFSGVD